MIYQQIFSFDVLLACLAPVAILLVAHKLLTPWTWADLRVLISFRRNNLTNSYGPFSLQKAYHSYAKYNELSSSEILYKRAAYTSLSRAHKRLGNKLGYPEKLTKLQHVADLNAVVTEGIAEVARNDPHLQVDGIPGPSGSGDLGRVRESLKHFIRDWSEEGAHERNRIFEPILNVLSQVDSAERKHTKVLVPGAGLGRLAWEISQRGT